VNTQTQKQRLLDFLKKQGEQGALVYQLQAPRPNGLGLAQYNARIFELRAEGHNIVSIEPGHFVLKERNQEVQQQNVPSSQIPEKKDVETKISQLKQKKAAIEILKRTHQEVVEAF
jgi:hypothetical protein